MNIILYSTGCPKCKVLERKLSQKNIPFILSNDINILLEKGFTTAPVLFVNDKFMTFIEANSWINSYKQMEGKN